jgi:TetR/AcrR family transcriptional repressor of nem operon
MFHVNGYTAVGVADICLQAGVVKGSFYHFFPSKAELLVEVLRGNWAAVSSAIDSLEQTPLTGRARLERFLGMIVGNGTKMHNEHGAIFGCNIGVVAGELALTAPKDKNPFRDIFQQWRAALQHMIETGIRDGSIAAEADSAAIASSLLASIQGMSVMGRTFNDPEMLAAIAGQAMRQVPLPDLQ